MLADREPSNPITEPEYLNSILKDLKLTQLQKFLLIRFTRFVSLADKVQKGDEYFRLIHKVTNSGFADCTRHGVGPKAQEIMRIGRYPKP